MRKLSIMSISVVLLILSSQVLSQDLLFFNDFETGTNEGWITHLGSGVSMENPKNGIHSMMINDNNQTNLGEVLKKFPATDLGIATFWFYYAGGQGGINILLNDEDGNEWHPSVRFVFWINPSGQLLWRLNHSSSYTDLPVPTNIGIGKWTFIELRWDSSNNSCEVLIDGESKGIIETQYFGNTSNIKPVSEIRFQGGRTPYKDRGFFDDISINSGWPPEIIVASIDFDPDILDLKSNGKWITCYLELPGEYNVDDIDITTLKIAKIGDVDVEIFVEHHPADIGDHDSDGISDLMIKFDRGAVIETLNGNTGEIEFTVTGNVNQTQFEGKNTIKVINGKLKKDFVAKDLSFAPTEFKLFQNSPNPFNPSTRLSFNLSEERKVQIIIYNSVGKLVRTLVDQNLSAGIHTIVWKGRNEIGQQVPSGLYLARMEAGEFTSTTKMLMLK